MARNRTARKHTIKMEGEEDWERAAPIPGIFFLKTLK